MIEALSSFYTLAVIILGYMNEHESLRDKGDTHFAKSRKEVKMTKAWTLHMFIMDMLDCSANIRHEA